MKENGIDVEIGLLENNAIEVNRGFFKRMKTGLPFITSKIAMSLDGRVAMRSGESKWITSEASRAGCTNTSKPKSSNPNRFRHNIE